MDGTLKFVIKYIFLSSGVKLSGICLNLKSTTPQCLNKVFVFVGIFSEKGFF